MTENRRHILQQAETIQRLLNAIIDQLPVSTFGDESTPVTIARTNAITARSWIDGMTNQLAAAAEAEMTPEHVHAALDPAQDGNASLLNADNTLFRRETCACGAHRTVHRYSGENIAWRISSETISRAGFAQE